MVRLSLSRSHAETFVYSNYVDVFTPPRVEGKLENGETALRLGSPFQEWS